VNKVRFISLVGALILLATPQLVAHAEQNRATNEVNVTLTDFKVELSTDSLPAGTPITFVINNAGKSEHEAVLELSNAMDEPVEVQGKEEEAEGIAPGETRTVVWTVPTPGTYKLSCHIPGHYEMGMWTTFAVTAAGTGQIEAMSTGASLPPTGAGDPWGSSLPALLALLSLGLIGAGLRLARGRGAAR